MITKKFFYFPLFLYFNNNVCINRTSAYFMCRLHILHTLKRLIWLPPLYSISTIAYKKNTPIRKKLSQNQSQFLQVFCRGKKMAGRFFCVGAFARRFFLARPVYIFYINSSKLYLPCIRIRTHFYSPGVLIEWPWVYVLYIYYPFSSSFIII